MATPDIQNLFERFLQIYGGPSGPTEPARSEPRYRSSQPAYSAPADVYGSDDAYAPTGGVLRGWSPPSSAAPWWAQSLAGPAGPPVGLRGPRLGGRLGGVPLPPMPVGRDDVVETQIPHLERLIPQSTRDFWNVVVLLPQMLRGQLRGDDWSSGTIEGGEGASSPDPSRVQPPRPRGGPPPWIMGPAILNEEREGQARTSNQPPPPVDPNFRRLTRIPPIALGSEGGNVASNATIQSGSDGDSRPSSGVPSPPLVPDQEPPANTLEADTSGGGSGGIGGNTGSGGNKAERDRECNQQWQDEKYDHCPQFGKFDAEYQRKCEERAVQRLRACYRDQREPSKYSWEDVAREDFEGLQRWRKKEERAAKRKKGK